MSIDRWDVNFPSEETDLRIHGSLALLHGAFFAIAIGTAPSRAQYAAQFYPYCALSPANGATTCYFKSRAECGSNCISNPWYVGPEHAWAGERARPRKRE